MLGNNYLDEDDDYFRQKLTLEELTDNDIQKFLKRISEKEEVPCKIVTPKPGFCAKTYTPEGDKVFINICYTDVIPDPDDISEEELEVILKSDASTYRIPMSIGELHVEADRSGNLGSAYDIAVSENFFHKIVTSQFFQSFFLVVVLESLEEKYSLGKLSFSPDKPYNILRFRKCIGTLTPHRIQQRPVNKNPIAPPKPLIEEIGDGPNTNQLRAVITSKKPVKPLIEEILPEKSTIKEETEKSNMSENKNNRKRDQSGNNDAISEKLRKQNEEFDSMLEKLMVEKKKNGQEVANIPVKETAKDDQNGKKDDLFTGCNKNLLKSKFFNCIADKEDKKVVKKEKEKEISTAITIKQDSLDDDDQSLDEDLHPAPKKAVIEEMDKIIEHYIKDNKLESSGLYDHDNDDDDDEGEDDDDDDSQERSTPESEIISPDLNRFEISTRYSRINPEAGLDDKTQLLVNMEGMYRIFAFPIREEPDLLFIVAKYKSLSGSEIILDLKEDQVKVRSEQQDEILIINLPININVSKTTAQFYVNSQDLKIIAPIQFSQSND